MTAAYHDRISPSESTPPKYLHPPPHHPPPVWHLDPRILPPGVTCPTSPPAPNRSAADCPVARPF